MEYNHINELIDDNNLPEELKEKALAEYVIAGRIYDKMKHLVPNSETPKEEYQLEQAKGFLRLNNEYA